MATTSPSTGSHRQSIADKPDILADHHEYKYERVERFALVDWPVGDGHVCTDNIGADYGTGSTVDICM